MVSLGSLLTPQRLLSLAGYGYERGERYAQQGHVVACELKGEVLEGIVAGSESYRVRILARGQQLVADCTCPIGMRGGMCKHAVALALHHLAAGSAPVRQVAPATGEVFATRDELDRWATEHRVVHELGLSSELIVPELTTLPTSLGYMLSRWTLGDLGSLDGARAHLQGWSVQREVAEAVHRRLEHAVSSVREAIAHEGVVPPIADPAFEPLRARLVELRRELRISAVPRSLARTPGLLQFDADAVAIVWEEPIKVGRGTAMFAFAPVAVRLRFASHMELTCTCKATACTHGIALIDNVLAQLAAPTDFTRRIVEEVSRPPWRRALAALATDDDVAAKARAEIELWWHVETELGSLTLTPVVKRRLKKGTLSAGSRVAPGRLLDEHGTVLGDQDLRIAEHLVSWSRSQRATYPVRAFAALVGHPHVATEDGDPIEVMRVPLGYNAIEAGDHIRLEPSVRGARFSPRLLAPLLETFAVGEPLVVLEPEHARCLLIDVGDDARRLWSVLVKHGDTFPPESHGELLDRLAAMDRRLPIAVPPALMGDRLDDPPVTVMRLRLVGDELELDAFVRAAEGAPLYPPGAGPRDVMLLRDGKRGYVRRDLGTELEIVRAALARLPLDGVDEGPPLSFQIHDPEQALEVVARLQDPPPGIEAEWIDTTRVRVVRATMASALRVQIDRKRDWFGIDGDLKVEAGRIELALVLDAVRRQRKFVRLDAERWVELTDVLRQRLAGLADRTFEGRGEGKLELSPAAVGDVRALVDAGAKVDAVPAWELITEKLVAATKLRPRPSPALQATLRPYQIEGHAWLARLAAWGVGGVLADDMGLGKTVQAIAMLLDRAKLGPALVLAPTSVSLNWVDELRRFAPSLRPVVYGEEADRIACLATLGKKDVLIVSYGLLARDAERLAATPFATLVADEAQALKNPQTSRAKAARALDAQFRVAMSGTPFENHLGELWSLFAIVFPGLLGSWEQFRTRFAVPIERDRNAAVRAALSRVIRPFLLRRTKAEVAPELPPRTEIEVPVALSTEETELYEDARLAALAQLKSAGGKVRDEQRRFQVLAALTRLRLLASHPRLHDPTSPIESSKMQRLLELAEELRAEGHRALVFSQFTTHLALVREALAKAGFRLLYLDGSTPTATRAELIKRFQAGEADIFLISLKAGGTGINLTAAGYVIHLDPWWNPAVEDQATDRAHRIGQTKPVTVYRLISRGTVEEKILDLHGSKRALVAGVLDGSDAAAKLSTRDLLELLGEPT